ncbi:MAG: DUF6482 family protein [Porticoccaceae bacterium]|jgi:hypothetical protein
MKILLDHLAAHQPIPRVIIHSLDASIYQVSVEIDGSERPLWETPERLLSRRNLTALRELFAGLAIGALVLRQRSAYDEMVGQPLREGANTLEVPLDTRTYTLVEGP